MELIYCFTLFYFILVTEGTTPALRKHSVDRGVTWLLSQRDDQWGWATRANAEAIFTLQLATSGKWYDPKLPVTAVSVKEANLELLAAIDSSSVSGPSWYGGKLAQYINGLISSCQNPRKFYGHDLVRTLKIHMDSYPKYYFNHMFTYSWGVIALCNANEHINLTYKRRLVDHAIRGNFSFGIDEASMVLIALSCLPTNGQVKVAKTSIETYINHRIKSDGSFGNEYTTSLALQALYTADRCVYKSKLYEKAADILVKAQNKKGGFQNLLAAFHVLPVLNGRSYLDIGKIEHCRQAVAGVSTITITVKRRDGSLKTYNDIHAPNGSKLLQFMQVASKTQCFSYKGTQRSWGLLVTTLNGIKSNLYQREYWQILKYDSRRQLTPLNKGVSSYVPTNGEHILFRLHTY